MLVLCVLFKLVAMYALYALYAVHVFHVFHVLHVFHAFHVCLPACLPTCLPACLSLCLFVCLSLRLCACVQCHVIRRYGKVAPSLESVTGVHGVEWWFGSAPRHTRAFAFGLMVCQEQEDCCLQDSQPSPRERSSETARAGQIFSFGATGTLLGFFHQHVPSRVKVSLVSNPASNNGMMTPI